MRITMAEFEVVEHFISINGEGVRAGQLALFFRFKGCNLKCKYCDTQWANSTDADCIIMTEEDIADLIETSRIHNVTITGGEPLYRKNMDILLKKISRISDVDIEIETNGSIDLTSYKNISDNITFTVDYKLGCSGMKEKMFVENYKHLTKNDTVKFVVGSYEDLIQAKDIIEHIQETGVKLYLSPVFGSIEAKEIVQFMIDNKMNGVNLQLQLHKYIWNPSQRGV